jgi:hypothetical protein
MSKLRLFLIFLFIDFALLTGWAIYHVGFMGIFEAAMSGPGAIQIFVDLVIVCGLGIGVMWADAKKQGINPLPFVIVTCVIGSFGLMAYLIRRGFQSEPTRAPAVSQA